MKIATAAVASVFFIGLFGCEKDTPKPPTPVVEKKELTPTQKSPHSISWGDPGKAPNPKDYKNKF